MQLKTVLNGSFDEPTNIKSLCVASSFAHYAAEHERLRALAGPDRQDLHVKHLHHQPERTGGSVRQAKLGSVLYGLSQSHVTWPFLQARHSQKPTHHPPPY